ncbi:MULTISPECIES: hypothetical protein [Sorangium]|nr:hypothetical protein [Sorangium cellulosum]
MVAVDQHDGAAAATRHLLSTWVIDAAAGRRCAPIGIEDGLAPIHFG